MGVWDRTTQLHGERTAHVSSAAERLTFYLFRKMLEVMGSARGLGKGGARLPACEHAYRS